MSLNPTFARRDVLRGAAVLLGGAALGLSPVAAFASAALPSSTISLGFWNGRRFVAPERLRAVGNGLERVRVTVSSLEGGGFAALEAHAPNPEIGLVPFTLWVAPPAGPTHSCAILTSGSDGSLLLVACGADGRRHDVRLPASALREGTYVLASGAANWSALNLDAESGVVQAGGSLPCLRIDVEAA